MNFSSEDDHYFSRQLETYRVCYVFVTQIIQTFKQIYYSWAHVFRRGVKFELQKNAEKMIVSMKCKAAKL